MKSIRRRLFLTVAIVFCLQSRSAAQETGFVHRTVKIYGVSYQYQVFVLSQWAPDELWPVILFLHGAGERGADGTSQTDEGLPVVLRQNPDFPAVVVMPQCRRRTWWGDPAMETQTFKALEESMNEFSGDPEMMKIRVDSTQR